MRELFSICDKMNLFSIRRSPRTNEVSTSIQMLLACFSFGWTGLWDHLPSQFNQNGGQCHSVANSTEDCSSHEL